MTELSKDIPWLQRVAMGKVDGATLIRRSAETHNIQAATPAELWDYGETEEVYTYSVAADIDTISSSNAGDSMTLLITGLDADYNEVVQTKALNGQAKVVLDTPIMRFHSAFVTGSTEALGDIYVYVDGAITAGVPDVTTTVRGFIEIGAGQSLQVQFTIPAGFTGYFYNLERSIIKTAGAVATGSDWKAIFRLFGGIFITASTDSYMTSGTSNHQVTGAPPNAFPEKTDFSIIVDVSANGVGAAASYNFLLMDNTIFGNPFA